MGGEIKIDYIERKELKCAKIRLRHCPTLEIIAVDITLGLVHLIWVAMILWNDVNYHYDRLQIIIFFAENQKHEKTKIILNAIANICQARKTHLVSSRGVSEADDFWWWQAGWFLL